MPYRIIPFLIGLIYSFHLTAQTGPIAHKSHNGTIYTYSPEDYTDNLGIVEPFPMLDSVVKINHNTVVFYYNEGQAMHHYDTIVDDPVWLSPDINLDSVAATYYGPISLIGFDQPGDSTGAKVCKKPLRQKELSPSVPILPSHPGNNNQLMLLALSVLVMSTFLYFRFKKQTIS